MTHTIKHQYDELLPTACPGLEIHVVYQCESEIEVDEDGEHDPRLISIASRAHSAQLSFTLPAPKFPREQDSQQSREFLAKLRESARQALWAKALRMAKEAGYTDPQHIKIAAERWQRTGDAVATNTRFVADFMGKPVKNFIE